MKNFTVLSYELEEVSEWEGDSVGEIVLKDDLTGEIHKNTIWYDEGGNHYFCWGTGEYNEDDNEIIEDDLLEYHTDYVNPLDVPNEWLTEKLKLITLYNEKILDMVEGDQSLAVGLITFTDELQGVSIWNPFYDSSLRNEVIPTDAYTGEQLLTMLIQIASKEVYNTGGNCMVDLYKVKIDSEVKCIGVTSECIVGFGDSDPFEVEIPNEIWVVHTV